MNFPKISLGLSSFQDYWLTIVTWDFWAGKTKNAYQEAYFWKRENPNWLLIANIPYDFVDFHFSSKSDLDKILTYLEQYTKDTNTFERMKVGKYTKIRVLIDEAHLYFFSRDFKAFSKSALLILTQCRKRNIQISFITQELAQIDVFMRRLMPYVLNYSSHLWLVTATMFYFKVSEVSDIWDEMNVELVETEYLLPNRLMLRIRKKAQIQKYFAQKHLTYYVIGCNELLKDFTYDQFYDMIQNKYTAQQKLDNALLVKQNRKNGLFSKRKPIQTEHEPKKENPPTTELWPWKESIQDPLTDQDTQTIKNLF